MYLPGMGLVEGACADGGTEDADLTVDERGALTASWTLRCNDGFVSVWEITGQKVA